MSPSYGGGEWEDFELPLSSATFAFAHSYLHFSCADQAYL